MWAPAAVDVLMRPQSNSTTKQALHLLGHSKSLRVNPTVPTGTLNLNRVDADDMIGLATHVSRLQSPEFSDLFADHFAAAYNPGIPQHH